LISLEPKITTRISHHARRRIIRWRPVCAACCLYLSIARGILAAGLRRTSKYGRYRPYDAMIR
jgi:hypothetical protein